MSQTLKKVNTELDFQKVYQTAYSHGLERIYAIEDIDLKTVRVMGGPTTDLPDEQLDDTFSAIVDSYDPQLELDLGEEFRGWMPSFVLQEPIQVLSLSKHAEKSLLEHQKKTIDDLMRIDWTQLSFIKGFGQGHIDEVQKRLKEYLEGKQVQQCRYIDFAAWLKCLFGALDKRKTYIFLETYSLSELISLTPAEVVQVKQLSSQKKCEWICEMDGILKQETHTTIVAEQMQMVVNVFVKPWMNLRHGFATKSEIFERLQRISAQSELTSSTLALFSEVFYQFKMPFGDYLTQISEELYCTDESIKTQYHLVLEKAKSYFYKPNLYYELADLTTWLEREFARNWHSFPNGFIETVLKQSPELRVRKGEHGCLVVRLA